MPKKRKSLVGIANDVIPFPLAASWAGVDAGGRAKAHCPFWAEHDDGGDEQSLRVYRDHGYCFAESRYFTVTSLLSAVWEVDKEDAAAEALRRFGHKPADQAHLWEHAGREPEPDREALARALTTWCEARCADWGERQYDDRVAARLARCLGLLPLVRTRKECEIWLKATQDAMAHYLL